MTYGFCSRDGVMGEGPQNLSQVMCVTQGGGLCIQKGSTMNFGSPRILDSMSLPHLPARPLSHRPAASPALLTAHFLPQDIYESLDLRQRRASSPGYIDSPTYSRQGMSPTFSRSPHHYYRSGKEGGSPQRDKKSRGTTQWPALSPAAETAQGPCPRSPSQHSPLGGSVTTPR